MRLVRAEIVSGFDISAFDRIMKLFVICDGICDRGFGSAKASVLPRHPFFLGDNRGEELGGKCVTPNVDRNSNIT